MCYFSFFHLCSNVLKSYFFSVALLLMKPEVHGNMTEIHYQANSAVNFAADHHKVILLFCLVLL